MNRYSLSLALPLILLFACSESKPKEQSQALLKQAEELLQANDYERSIAMVDSAVSLSLADTATLRRAIGLKKVIRLREAEQRSRELISDIEALYQSKEQYMRQVGITLESREAYGVVAAPTYRHPKLSHTVSQGLVWEYDAETNSPRVRALYTGNKALEYDAVRLPDLLSDTLEVGRESAHHYQLDGQSVESALLRATDGVEPLKIALISLEGVQPDWVRIDSLPQRKPAQSLRVVYLREGKELGSFILSKEHVNALREMALMTHLLQRIRQGEIELAKYLQRQQRLNARSSR